MFRNASTSRDDDHGETKPKSTRLGVKKVENSSSGTKIIRRGNKTPKSDQSDAGSEDWSEIGSEEMNAIGAAVAEPPASKSYAYKCGPVDKDEVMSRLRAHADAPRRERVADWVIEKQIEDDIVPPQEVSNHQYLNCINPSVKLTLISVFVGFWSTQEI